MSADRADADRAVERLNACKGVRIYLSNGAELAILPTILTLDGKPAPRGWNVQADGADLWPDSLRAWVSAPKMCEPELRIQLYADGFQTRISGRIDRYLMDIDAFEAVEPDETGRYPEAHPSP